MIFDKTLEFSANQAITGDAASTNSIDLGATGTVYGAAAALTRDVGKSNEIPILVQVTESFNTLTSLTVQVQVDSASDFSSAKTIASQTVVLAKLVAGFAFNIVCMPHGADQRYVRLNYDVTGSNPTAGKITAGVVMGVQTNGVNFS